MILRTGATCAACLLSIGLSATARAQDGERASFGAAVTLARLPQPKADQPASVFPYVEAPYGNSRGLEVFGDVSVSRRLAIGAELSLAPALTLTTVESHPSTYATRTTSHQDTIVVGTLRARVSRFVHVVGGGGLVFARTSLTVSGWTRATSGNVPFGPEVFQSPSNGARPALTVGADFVVPLRKHLAFCGVARLHHLLRAASLHEAPFGRADDARPFLQPAADVFRLGVGVRVLL